MTRKTIMLLAIVVLLNNSKELIILTTVKFLSQVKLSVISMIKHKSQTWLGKNMANIERYYGDRTSRRILSAVKSMAEDEPLSVTVPFRGYDVVCMDAYEIVAYKVGNRLSPLTVKWEEITPVEALMLKRASKYTLDRMQADAEIRLNEIIRLRETFEKSPFGC